MISFAGSGDNSRTSQLFISYGSAKSLGTQKWETAVGEVIEGMENVEKFYSYGVSIAIMMSYFSLRVDLSANS
jgi:cyclophilin family peptidyl-prolyl cis-trans isomerase